VSRTVPTLEIVRIDADRGLLLVRGSVPGHEGGHIVVKPAAKTPKSRAAAKK
jgi:large subunit ribosomal protein L3